MDKKMIHHLESARSELEMVTSVSQFAESLGFDWLTYCSGGDPSQIFSTYPNAWCDYYKEKQFHLFDPVCHLTRQSSAYFIWNYRELRAKEQLVGDGVYIREALDFGIDSGISIKISPRSSKGVITLSKKSRPDVARVQDSEFHHLVKEWGGLLESKLQDFMPKFQKKASLTRRQKELLHEVSQGKSAKVIAQQKGLSYRTVEYHLEEAKKRLQAATITQAIAVMLANEV